MGIGKRIIGLRLIDVSHNGENISERIFEVLKEYGLNDKTFSITLDNASANTSAMVRLTHVLRLSPAMSSISILYSLL
jgi:archaellum component FlaF (FlaF/FlaG flagellin family)